MADAGSAVQMMRFADGSLGLYDRIAKSLYVIDRGVDLAAKPVDQALSEARTMADDGRAVLLSEHQLAAISEAMKHVSLLPV